MHKYRPQTLQLQDLPLLVCCLATLALVIDAVMRYS